jgi:hypothetical protein
MRRIGIVALARKLLIALALPRAGPDSRRRATHRLGALTP